VNHEQAVVHLVGMRISAAALPLLVVAEIKARLQIPEFGTGLLLLVLVPVARAVCSFFFFSFLFFCPPLLYI